MRAFKEMKAELETPLQTVGHIPGFRAGDTFRCKGELAIVGIHCNIAGGIYFGYALTACGLSTVTILGSCCEEASEMARMLGHCSVH